MIPPEARQEIEAVLSAFRQWLLESEQWGLLLAAPDEGCKAGEPLVDLHTLVGEWVALRQEFRLASRGSKADREQLVQAVDAFHSGIEEVSDRTRVLLDSLVRDRDRVRDDLQVGLESQEKKWVELLLDTREVIARGVDASRQAYERLGWRKWFLPRALFGSLLEGHDLALRRIDAAVQSHGISPIECEGRPVDPERMRVVDLIQHDDLPPGQVVEVLRRGYVRGNRVIRFAEVRAVAGPCGKGSSAQGAPEAPASSGDSQEE